MEKFIPFSSEFTFSHIWLTVPDAMLITLVVYIIVRLLWLRKMRLSRTILCGLFAVYLAALAALLLFPLHFSGCRFDWGGISAAFAGANFIPFFTTVNLIREGLWSPVTQNILYGFLWNFLIFVPFGVLVPMIWRRIRPLSMVFVSLGTALGIELLQLLENAFRLGNNSVNIDDVIFNFAGCILAYLLYLGVRTAFRHGGRR